MPYLCASFNGIALCNIQLFGKMPPEPVMSVVITYQHRIAPAIIVTCKFDCSAYKRCYVEVGIIYAEFCAGEFEYALVVWERVVIVYAAAFFHKLPRFVARERGVEVFAI